MFLIDCKSPMSMILEEIIKSQSLIVTIRQIEQIELMCVI